MAEGEKFEAWCIIEQMGHKRIAGFVREVTIAGHGFLRIDVPGEKPDEWVASQMISPASGSIYSLTPVTEAAARLVAKGNRPEPVHSWELPQIEHRSRNGTVCAYVAEENGSPRQCGMPDAEWDADSGNFRCEAHQS